MNTLVQRTIEGGILGLIFGGIVYWKKKDQTFDKKKLLFMPVVGAVLGASGVTGGAFEGLMTSPAFDDLKPLASEAGLTGIAGYVVQLILRKGQQKIAT